MKRNLLVLMIITVLALALMTACSPKTETPTVAPTAATAAPSAYPVKQEATPQTVATAYPATAPVTAPTSSGKLTDEQVLTLIETQLNEHHTVDFLLSKKLTADQWVEVINNEFHNDVFFTADELDQVVAYLIANQK